MANVREINNPLNLGAGEIGVDAEGRWWGRDRRGRVSQLTSQAGNLVRVIGGPGGRTVVPSANTPPGGLSGLDAVNLITNVSAFAGKLSATDTNVQLALDTLDDHVHVHSTNTSLLVDDHTIYALLLGRAGGQSLSGGDAANDDLTLQGTTHATRTTSYVLLQPNGGNVGIGTSTPNYLLEVSGGSAGIPTTSAAATRGLVVTDGTTKILNYQGLDLGGLSYAFFGTNRTYGAGGWSSTGWYGARKAASLQIQNDTFNFYQFAAGVNNPNTEVFRIESGGAVGILKGVTIGYVLSTTAPVNGLLVGGNVGIAITPTANLHLPAGTATASTGPLKFTPAGAVLVTTPESGLFEVIGDLVHYTIPTGPTRKTFSFTSDAFQKVSANDTTPGYLNGKLVAGTGITLTEGSDGGNETLTIAAGTQIYYGASTVGTDAYAITPSPAATSYYAGMLVLLYTDVISDATSTIDVSALGPKSILLGDGSALNNGSIRAGGMHLMAYDGTAFRLVNQFA